MASLRFVGLLGLCALAGCTTGPALTSVSGVVTLDEKPLTGATVRFIPQDETLGHGGSGKTDQAGKYEIVANRQNNRKGLLPGAYRVVISQMPPEAKPIESNVIETVPEPYCNPRESPLQAVVETTAKPFDFALKKK